MVRFSEEPMKSEGLPRRKQLVTITVTEFLGDVYKNAEQRGLRASARYSYLEVGHLIK